MNKIKVGVVGCGNISGIYLKNMRQFEVLEVVACSDLIPERSRQRAGEFGVPRPCTNKELFADPGIRVVVNLTTPNAHYIVAKEALLAGKSVYNEKPLAITRAEGKELLALAEKKKLLVGGAPDTFLGGGHQTCRKLIDDGAIGTPVAATAFMLNHGHESWHPDPEFYYKNGGGPMFDMGPYYLTDLINCLGPARRVTGSARITFPERTVTSAPKRGSRITVDVPTHIAGIIDFSSGAVATIITSFDVWAHHLPLIEIHGTEGSLSVPDPNGFGGAVQLRKQDEKEWKDVPHTHGWVENSRGLGVADMATALLTGRRHRASGELTYHVLDMMHAFHDASREGKHVLLESTCSRPQALPMGLTESKLDE